MLADDPDCGVLAYCDAGLYAFYSIHILPQKPVWPPTCRAFLVLYL